MKRKVIDILKYIIFLSIGIALLWFALKDQDIKKIIIELSNVNYFWVILSVVLGVIAVYIRAMRWNILINTLGYKKKLSGITTYHAVMIGYFANLAIPRIGEITRCGVINKQYKISINSVIGTVIIERIFDMICLSLIILFTILFQINLLWSFIEKLFKPIFVSYQNLFSNSLYLNLKILAIAIISIISFVFIIRLIIPRIKKLKIFYRIKRMYLEFLLGIKSIRKVKKYRLFLFHTFTLWFFYTIMVYVCFFSMKETSSLTFVDAISIMAIGSLGIVAPVQGGIGAYEIIVIPLLVTIYNINKDVATSFTLLLHSSQIIMMIIFGCISLLFLFFKGKKKVIKHG